MDRYVGKRLDGRYEIEEIIGVGGMAVVYKAHDNVEDRTVAIKILKEEFVSNEEFIRRFKNESKAIAMLSHPNIVKVYDVSFGDLIQYIVMEYIDGITLKEYIERQGSLRWKDAVYFTVQILKGLQHAHDKGIVHRDVKPQNIMVLSDGTIKVTDFGIARFARSEQRTITDKAIGSVHYISPEQARGEKTDEKADIYSVGVMLYEMLTGKLPFQADSAVSVAIMQLQRDPQLPTEINASIPLGLEQITMHAMQKTLERRYQSAAEMLCDVERFKKDPSATFDYSYFVDNSPTKFVNTVMSSTPASAVADEDYEQEEVKEKNNMIPILAGIAATLIIAIIVLGIIFIPRLFTSTGDEIACPKFVGLTLEEVKNNEEYKDKFKFTEEWDYDSEYKYGYIFKQDPSDGKKLKKGAEITLYVSKGQSTIKVPDVYGKTESYAVSELKSKGFVTEINEVADDDIESGLVVKTEPARTTVVAEGTKITVFVSTGKATKMVDVPNVIGLKQEKAVSDIKKLGLVPAIEKRDLTSKDKYYDAGYVISQNPDANSSSQVAEGTTVTIYVSTGVTNYNFDLRADLPSDFKASTGTVSLWEDGKLIKESETVAFSDISNYTFKGITSTDKTMTATIKLKAKDGDYIKYRDIEIDCSTGKYDTIKRYEDYKKYSDGSSTEKSQTY
ncbi:MAG: Stk1 family PASTA domain-containing Ser/Thr kinase [Clostridia bacterium]|nr:Stk1 family PASTA domain-containing Ser/Thr kinase [Clostridia bacterium]